MCGKVGSRVAPLKFFELKTEKPEIGYVSAKERSNNYFFEIWRRKCVQARIDSKDKM